MKIQFGLNLERLQVTAAKFQKHYQADDLMGVVFKDECFNNAEIKINAIRILKQHGIDDVKSV